LGKAFRAMRFANTSKINGFRAINYTKSCQFGLSGQSYLSAILLKEDTGFSKKNLPYNQKDDVKKCWNSTP
jgi:hypothetical protein